MENASLSWKGVGVVDWQAQCHESASDEATNPFSYSLKGFLLHHLV